MNTASSSPTYQIAAYFPEWRVRDAYFVRNIESAGSADRLTLINYAFGIPAPDPASGQIVPTHELPEAAYGQVYSAAMSVDGQADDPGQPLRGHFNQLRKLKARHPQIRVVVSLGGWTGSGWFSVAARTPESREKFVAACVDFYVKGNLPLVNGAGGPGAGAGVFDGIDIDWEYPVRGGLADNHTHPEDGANFVLLLAEFRRQFSAAGRPDFLLTAAVPGPGQARQYNMREAHAYLDFVMLMAYDLRGAWSGATGHHTGLCSSEYDPAPAEQRISSDATVRLYRDELGVPPQKLVLGAGFYGHGWKNVPDMHHGLFQPGVGLEEGGSSYHILKHLPERGFTRYWDETASAPYLYNPAEQVFWSYDDPESLGLKAGYVRYHGLGGMMFWEIAHDDAQGSLVKAIDDGLKAEIPAKDPCG
jgi:chitinase